MLLVHVVGVAAQQVLPRPSKIGVVLRGRLIVLALGAVHSILSIENAGVVTTHILLVLLLLLLHGSLLL